MANIKSQIKRNKQNEKARLRNKAAKSELKTSVRKFRQAADAGDVTATLHWAGQHHVITELDPVNEVAVVQAGRAQRRPGPRRGGSRTDVRPRPVQL